MPSINKVPKLSKLEQKLLILLPSDGSRISTNELVVKFYGDDQPFAARTIVAGRMLTIVKKIEAGAPGPKIGFTDRRGPMPKEYWIVLPD